jgi:potassium/hydrogen antiporter
MRNNNYFSGTMTIESPIPDLTPVSEMLPGISEPAATAVLLAVFGLMVGLSVLFSRTADRLGIPVVLLFLVLGMLGGSEGLGVEFEDYQLAVHLGITALVLILFDGGLNTTTGSIRQVVYPSAVLATVGVVATAGMVTLCARVIGLSWTEGFLLGAVVSSTDAAAVFAVLRGGRLQLQPRLGRTLEVESCVNDPMAVILTVTAIGVIVGEDEIRLRLLYLVPLQLVIGMAVGVVIGWLGWLLLSRIRLTVVGLYPAMTLSLAFLSFGVATMVWGSGFLAVYATAVVLGNRPLPHRSALVRIHDALAWLSQIGMFLMLGLLVFPSRLLDVAVWGLGIGLFLAVLGRPVAVIPCLLPFGYRMREMAYVGWNGLRGGVPIILATFPVLAQVPGAERVFHLVFFIVVVSTIVPGSTIRFVTRKLGLDTPEKPLPPAVLEINSAYPLGGELTSFFIEPSAAVCGARLSQIDFPQGSAVVLIVRGRELVAARGNTKLEEGDHVYVFFKPEDRPFIELLFGRPEEG